MNICPDCYNDVSEWESHCKCGWEKPKRAPVPIQKIFAKHKREQETESDRLARERCMATMKTFKLGATDTHQWAHKLADRANAGERLTIGQMAKLKGFEVNTGERLFEVTE